MSVAQMYIYIYIFVGASDYLSIAFKFTNLFLEKNPLNEK